MNINTNMYLYKYIHIYVEIMSYNKKKNKSISYGNIVTKNIFLHCKHFMLIEHSLNISCILRFTFFVYKNMSDFSLFTYPSLY